MTGFLVCTTATYGKPEYAKKEKKACTFCHAKIDRPKGGDGEEPERRRANTTRITITSSTATTQEVVV